MQGTDDSFPVDWKRTTAKQRLPRETKQSRRRTRLYDETDPCATTDPAASNRRDSPTKASSGDRRCRLSERGAPGTDRGVITNHHAPRRRSETQSAADDAPMIASTASRERRCPASDAPKNCRYIVRVFCFFVVVVVVVGSCAVRAKIEGERRTELEPEEFEDNFPRVARSLSDTTVFDYRVLYRPVSDFSRSTRIPKSQKVTKNHSKGIQGQKKPKGISKEEEEEKKKAQNTTNAESDKLDEPVPAELKKAEENSEWMDWYCREPGVVPGCQPVPVVLHIDKMGYINPENISNYGKLRTVVARCPPIPCCKEGHTCRTTNSTEFKQPFKLKFVNQPKIQSKIVKFDLQNDTACGCRKTHPSVRNCFNLKKNPVNSNSTMPMKPAK